MATSKSVCPMPKVSAELCHLDLGSAFPAANLPDHSPYFHAPVAADVCLLERDLHLAEGSHFDLYGLADGVGSDPLLSCQGNSPKLSQEPFLSSSAPFW